jgi:DNA-directed RNA polymerase
VIYSNFQRNASSSAGAAHDESLLNQEIENLTNACFSQILPDEIFYRNDEQDANNNNNNKPLRTMHNNNNSHSSLDQELGIDTVWDSTLNNEEDNNEGNFDLENEQNSNGDYIVEENQIGENDLNDSDSDSFNNGSTSTGTGTTSVMEMLRNFDPLKPPEVGGDPEELQLWLECFSQRETVIRHQELVKKARDRKAFDSMSLMQRHVVQWFQGLQNAIDTRQKEFLSNQDKRRASNRYGPFLCSLHPDKMAVILSQEAITQALLNGGKHGKDGIALVKMARAIGTAVETEVVSQRRIKERYHNISKFNESSDDDLTDEEGGVQDAVSSGGSADDEKTTEYAIDSWTFSASHLKLYFEDLKRMGMGKNKRSIQYAMYRAKQAMKSEDTWTSDDLTHLGAALLSILTEHAKVNENGKEEPAFRVEKRWSNNHTKSTSFITIHDRLHKIFLEDEYLSWAANTTRHMPMIVPPSPWTAPNTGGYRWLEVEMMRTHRSNVQKEALQHADLSTVFDGLNILGKTSWKINKEILEIGEYCWENNVPIGDIPSRVDFEIPSEPIYPASFNPEVYADKENPENKIQINALQSYRDSTTKRQRILQKNMDLRSLRCSAMLKLNQAKKFKDFERIYFPYNLDFRGRAYPVPPHLSNVGSDLCRGMLTFSEEKPLGKRGLYWLKVHLANFAGKDKMSFDDRSDYIDANIENVRECASDPFSGNKWWMELDDPFQGLATCREIVRAIDSGNPETYMCSLPVHMDGSCNGLQHYAAIGRDTVGGKAVNLLESDGPEDVYVGVMHEVIRRVKEEAALDVAFDNDDDTLDKKKMKSLKNNKAAKLINGLIDRGVVKRTVMTSVYGVTYIGARQQIQEKIEEKLEEKGYDIDDMEREVFSAAGYVATVTMEVMGDLFQGAKKTKTWLADCARLISQQGHPVAWISPIGVPAIQPYRQRRPRTVVTVMQSVTVVDENDDLQVHKSRQCTAFPPNYIHSLDSSHMLMTALEMDRRGLTFSAVHDSFWTHACDIDEMNEALRDSFIELYSKPLLQDLKESWELRYPDLIFPDIPELGNLDLNEVKSATYFFQ